MTLVLVTGQEYGRVWMAQVPAERIQVIWNDRALLYDPERRAWVRAR